MYLHLFLWLLYVASIACTKGVLHLAVLVPNNDENCTQTAIQMAVDDINKTPDFIVGRDNVSYNLQAHFLTTDERDGNAIESQYRLYSKDPVKISTIGPPFKDQNEYCVEYSTAQANLHISYSEANEPLESYFIMFFQTPPAIISSFIAARSLFQMYNWSRVGIVYDYSDARYRKNADNLRETMEKGKNPPIKVLTDQGIWSKPVRYGVATEIGILQSRGIRIILALVSVSGARKVFCEAFKQKMLKPKVIWVLFEVLPSDWASDSYNSDFSDGGRKREIGCTEEELLSAANGYISLTKQGLRKDNKKTFSNVTSAQFLRRLNDNKIPDYKCDENVAYAYDAIWVTALSLRRIGRIANLSSYSYHLFSFTLPLANLVKKISFEALTGPLSYRTQLVGASYARIGQISVHVNRRGEKGILVGTHDTASDKLMLVPHATTILFDKGPVPKDKALYTTSYANFSSSLLIIMWLISFVGILMAVFFLIISLIFRSETNSEYTSTYLNCVIILGSMLCYLAVVVYGVDSRFVEKESIADVCYVFIWSLSIGFTLTFGSLFAKVWKMYKIYMTPDVKVASNEIESRYVPEWILFIIISAFLLVDVALLGTWGKMAPFNAEIKNITQSEDLFEDMIKIKQIITCTCEHQTEFTIGVYCYKGLMLVFGLFLVWQTRCAKANTQNTSKHIALAIYNVVAVSLIGVICVSVLSNTTRFEASYAIVAVCICICNTTTLLLVFIPKIRIIISRNSMIVNNGVNTNGNSSQETTGKYSMDRLSEKSSKAHSNGMQHAVSEATLNTQIPNDVPSRRSSFVDESNSMSFSNVGKPPANQFVQSISISPPSFQTSSYLSETVVDSDDIDSFGRLTSGVYVGSGTKTESLASDD